MHRTATQLNMTNVTLWRRAKRIGIAWLELKNTSSKKYLYKKYWMDYTPIIKHLNLKID
jgi:hypothetical protein